MQFPIAVWQRWSCLAPFQRYCRISAENRHSTIIPAEIWGCFHNTLRKLLLNYCPRNIYGRSTSTLQTDRQTNRRTVNLRLRWALTSSASIQC